MQVTFLANLKRETSGAKFRTGSGIKAYITVASPGRKATRSLVSQVSDQWLLIDNGNFGRIGAIQQKFSERAAVLTRRIRKMEEKLNHSVRRSQVPSTLVRQFNALAHAVEVAAVKSQVSRQTVLSRQQALSGDAIVGAEDIVPAVWMALDIEPAYMQASRESMRARNRAVARQAAIEIRSLNPNKTYYAVATAASYASAYDAGAEFALAKIRNLAIGLGGSMADDNYTDHVMLGNKIVDFGRKLPNRYIKVASFARGLADGYRSVARAMPDRIHCLGLGAPIMLPVVTLCFWGAQQLSFDAMSPLLDAVEGTMYVDQPSLLKVRTRQVAYKLATVRGATWTCPCFFCREFVNAYPFQYAIGRAWYSQTRSASVSASELRERGRLYRAYPLLSEPSTRERRQAVTYARMGHNHAALQRIARRLSVFSTRAQLRAFVHQTIEAYAKDALEQFARAVRFGVALADEGVR